MRKVVDRRKIQDAKEHQMKYFLKALAFAIAPIIISVIMFFIFSTTCLGNYLYCAVSIFEDLMYVENIFLGFGLMVCNICCCLSYIFSIYFSIRNMIMQGEDRKIGYFIGYVLLIIYCIICFIYSLLG